MKTRKEEKEMKKNEGVREYLLFIFLAWRVWSEVPLKERSRRHFDTPEFQPMVLGKLIAPCIKMHIDWSHFSYPSYAC